MNLSNRVKELQPSLTRRLFDLAKAYDDVIDLTLGDPDVLPPKSIQEAACKAIRSGQTRYSQNAGLFAVRDAVARFNSRFYRQEISAEEIILTCGGMEALYLLLASLVNEGDEVIIPGPYWINYKQMTELCGGKAVIVPTLEEDNFSLKASELEASITNHSKIIILNSPNNPSGRTISADVLDDIAQVAISHDLFVISDEVYRSLIYDGRKHESIWTRQGMRSRCAIVDSMSKRFSMTGYRLGMAIGPKDLIGAMTRFQENVAACAPLPSQYAALEGYGNNVDTSDMAQEFNRRRQIVLHGVDQIPNLSLSSIDGTFYAFVNIARTRINSYDFAMRLLAEAHVAVVPGRTYGKEYDDYVRIAFTVKEDRLQVAMDRIHDFVKGL